MTDQQIDQQNTETSRAGGQAGEWERGVLEKLAFAALAEQRRSRRWGIFFKSLTFLYLLLALAAVLIPLSEQSISRGKPHTAVIDVTGVIADGEEASAESIIKGLRAAVENESTRGIILKMNTPGGSPVQSSYVYNEIVRIKKQHKALPIYAVVADICASGGYYIASATDKIFVNPSSMIGSIGVIMNGFGFVDALRKLGIERRLMIAGEHKALLDPFSPERDQEKAHVQSLLNGVHETFIAAVKEGRGSRLADSPEIFSGLVWTGSEGVELGLADAFGDADTVARDIIGIENMVNFTPKEKLFDRLAHQIGTSAARMFQTFAGTMVGRLE